MKLIWIGLEVAAVAGLIVVLEWWRRRREYWDGPHYMEQIQVLKGERQLILPTVRPLVVKRHPLCLGDGSIVSLIARPCKPKPRTVTKFPQRVSAKGK